MITVLFLYRLVAWCFLRGMKFLSILMVGVALLAGGYGETKTEVLYHEDGSKKSEIPYVNDERHGTEICYWPNGLKMSETPYQKGAMHGTAMGYYEDGSKRSETPYVNNKKHGKCVKYNRDGSQWTEEYKEDELVAGTKNGTQIKYWDNGSKKEETFWGAARGMAHVLRTTLTEPQGV